MLLLLFGYIGEGNLYLNVLCCLFDWELVLYVKMMGFIVECGGNVSLEYGVGSCKCVYLGMFW